MLARHASSTALQLRDEQSLMHAAIELADEGGPFVRLAKRLGAEPLAGQVEEAGSSLGRSMLACHSEKDWAIAADVSCACLAGNPALSSFCASFNVSNATASIVPPQPIIQ
jgi:hypothetical protein